uniref:tRNA(His) guanylyltransferase n=1 Tax=Leersia perrieri TaxID=77586 RepID=A0A0D9X6U0_9ORYZ
MWTGIGPLGGPQPISRLEPAPPHSLVSSSSFPPNLAHRHVAARFPTIRRTLRPSSTTASLLALPLALPQQSQPAFLLLVVVVEGLRRMANSEYEYILQKIHTFEKTNDESALRLMNACATSMLEKFPDIVFAYGVSDEYRKLNSLKGEKVKSGKTEKEAQQALKDKNELLSQQFQINYDDEPNMFQKGSYIYYDKDLSFGKITSTFFEKKFDNNHRHPPCNWAVIRINVCQFEHSKVDECSCFFDDGFPDIVFGYGFSNKYSFVFQVKTESYQRQERYFPQQGLGATTLLRQNFYVSQNKRWFVIICHRDKQNGTLSKDKNELLFQQFGLNYNNEPAMLRKGSCAYRQKRKLIQVEGSAGVGDSKIPEESGVMS